MLLQEVDMINELVVNVKTGKSELKTRELSQQEIIEKENLRFEFQKNERLVLIDKELNELNKDFIQELCGAIIPNIAEKKARFKELHNEKRQLMGKEPRIYE